MILLYLIAVYLIIKGINTRRKTLQVYRDLTAIHDCQPPKHLPWVLPFGLEKLLGVLRAEKHRRYPLHMLEEHEKHGDTYAQYSGLDYVIITRDTENIREILSRKSQQFEIGGPRTGLMKPLLGESIFTQDGENWYYSRKVLAPVIKRPEMSTIDLFETHVQKLLAKFKPTDSNDASETIKVNLKPLFFDFAFDVTSEFLLGPSASTSTAEGAAFAQAYITAFRWISRRERLKTAFWLIDGLEFRMACRTARKLATKMIKRTVTYLRDFNAMENRIALLKLLRDDTDVSQVRDQFLSLLLAGRDTSGSLLCWCLYALSHEIKLFEELKHEISVMVAGQTPTKQELAKMPLLDNFIREVLRIFPPVPLNGRYNLSATTLPRGGGPDGQSPIICPAGTLVAFSAYAVHHNTSLWGADASKFNPRRWSHGDVLREKTMDGSYQPFLGGPRKCLGEAFAVEEAKYVVCRFVQLFEGVTAMGADGREVEKTGDWVSDVKYHVGLTMSPDEGVWVELR